ncbi:aspartyl protease family protein At5g10770 [Lolium perenne]|uniref:aspartyl protease family protein At5g10770 n=1 Tax=Lolium perenne TaxID=4522 RepID=UPI0021F5E5CF|nr:aspartyl protease family protein At5g10770-like [Lolium perenne]
MATAVLVPLLLLLLLFSSCATLTVDAAGADELNYNVVATSSFKAKAVCEGPRVNSTSAGFTNGVPVTRPHGPCSAAAAAAGAGSSEPSLVDALRWDQQRASYIQRMLSVSVNASMPPKLPPKSPTEKSKLKVASTDPVSEFHPGTPKKKKNKSSQLSIDPAATDDGGSAGEQTMVLDTASVFPWLQCAPCPVPPCHPQADTLYDPALSSTSGTFSCNSSACRQLGPFANGCANNQCQYRVRYPDGSTTMGTYVSDVMTLTPTRMISKFQFGCSHFAQGRSINTLTVGTMGLGSGSESLVSQGKGSYGNAFSYCIPPTASTTGFFLLGVPPASSSRYVVTPMVKGKLNPALYVVRLQAITVAGQQLSVPPTIFAAGSVMDSRAPITRLPPTAYQALRSAFRSRMTMYRAAPPKEHLDTCYDFTGVSSIRLPKIALVFDRNAAVELDPSGILFDGCLAFTSTSDDRDTGIIGNVQQRTIEVVYDVGGGAMAFRRAAC